MTPAKLHQLVSRAVDLDRAILGMTEELKELKQQLIQEAASRPEEFTSTDGGGQAWQVVGTDGNIARVNFPAPSLKSKIDGEGKLIEKIRAASGRSFDRLFRPTISYAPVDGFRTVAEELLARDSRKLIKLCESATSPRVSFETKEGSAT